MGGNPCAMAKGGRALTFLAMIQGVCRRVGHPPPTVAFAATDTTTQRLVALADDEGRDLLRYGDWRVLRKTHTFTTTATESQTGTPIPTDLGGFIDGTIWNRTTKQTIQQLDAEQWHYYKARTSFPFEHAFYLEGATWLQQPVPPAGQTQAYGYRSTYFCQSSGGTKQAAWAADTDTGVLSEHLMVLGITWRFKQSRGLDWQADYDQYKWRVDDELAKDQPRRIISMTGEAAIDPRGITTPEMNWLV